MVEPAKCTVYIVWYCFPAFEDAITLNYQQTSIFELQKEISQHFDDLDLTFIALQNKDNNKTTRKI